MPINPEALRQRAERKNGSGWEPKSGLNPVRLLPPDTSYFTLDLDYIAHDFRQHWINMPGEDPMVFRCNRDRNMPCLACQAYQMHKDAADPAARRFAEDNLKNAIRYIFNLVDLSSAVGVGKGVQTYECGPQVHKQARGYAANPQWCVGGDVLSLEAGNNFTIEKKSKEQSGTGYVEYVVTPDPQKTRLIDVLNQVQPNWMAALDEWHTALPEYIDETMLRAALERLGIRINAAAGTVATPFAQPVTTPAATPGAVGYGAMSAGGTDPSTAPFALPGVGTTAPPSLPAPSAEHAPAAVSAVYTPPPATPATMEVPPAAAPAAAAVEMPYTLPGAVVGTTPGMPAAPAAAPAAVPSQVADASGAMAAPTQVGNKVYPPGLQIDGGTQLPVCFSDFNAEVHPCNQCPDRTACQLAKLKMSRPAT